MTKAISLALCAALPLADASLGEDGREWVHLLPGGGSVRTVDGRGPYKVSDYAALANASLKPGESLVIDECHSTDLAAPKGQPAPARGWIVALQAREDGIWGEVEWNGEGRKLRADRAYRGISPVFGHLKDGTIVGIKRASLVNQPNLQGLTALHAEEVNMDMMKKIAAALGLAEDASEEEILEAIRKMDKGSPEEEVVQQQVQTALQQALKPIAGALGLSEGADSDAIVAGIGTLREGSNDGAETITALQQQVNTLSTKLDAMSEGSIREKAERFVDGAIAQGRAGVKPMRDEYVAMHMENPERTERIIGGLVKIASHAVDPDRTPKRSTDLTDADRHVIALMGLDPEDYKKTLAAEAGEQETF